MRYVLFLPMLAVAWAAQAVPGQRTPQVSTPQPSAVPQRKIPCKTPENVMMCYWTRGRLSFYNGNPPYRVWKIGTKRVLGIFSGPAIWPPRDQRDQMDPAMPANIVEVFDPPNNRVFADFEICPLEAGRVGWMQAACIESAKDVFVEDLR